MLHNPESAAGAIAMSGQTVILSEFAKELHGYCRKVENLAERMRALRSLRIGIVAARQQWTQTEAGEKCSNHVSCRTSRRAYRLRV